MPWEISHKTIWPVLSLVPLNRKEICMSPSPDSDEDDDNTYQSDARVEFLYDSKIIVGFGSSSVNHGS